MKLNIPKEPERIKSGQSNQPINADETNPNIETLNDEVLNSYLDQSQNSESKEN